MLDTPILLIVFNRPDKTHTVLQAIRQVRPKQLFVAGDGPRSDHPDDEVQVLRTRAVIEQVDWDCEIKTLFHDKNLGCGTGADTAPPTAITWFFQNVEQGIILEDDCLPDESFFYFCEELLQRYRDNDRVMHIGGNNFQGGRKRGRASYYFSRYPHVWGWATWRRAWQCFENGADAAQSSGYVWDRTWMLAVQERGGLSIVPNVNLVTNIGFDLDATHTSGSAWYARMPARQMTFPLKHPSSTERNKLADVYTHYAIFCNEPRPLSIVKLQVLFAMRNLARPRHLIERAAYWFVN